LNDFERPK